MEDKDGDMVGAGALGAIGGYLAKTATDLAKGVADKYKNKLKKAVTCGLNKDETQQIKKAAGDISPTGRDLSPRAQQRTGHDVAGHYGPTKTYGEKPEPAYAGTTYAALLAPLIIGVGWLTYIFLVGGSDIAAGQLSPSNMNRQIFLLSLFIIIYSIFLVLFSIGKEKAKKNIKKVKKKKK